MLDHVLTKLKEAWHGEEKDRHLARKFMFQLSIPKAFSDALKSDLEKKATAMGKNLEMSPFFLLNVLNQARNLLFKMLTKGAVLARKGDGSKDTRISRVPRDPLRERFAMPGLDKKHLDIILKLGNTQGRQRVRLIREVNAIRKLEKSRPGVSFDEMPLPSGKGRGISCTDILDIVDGLKARWDAFLISDDTSLFCVNETMPGFSGRSINTDLQDGSWAFRLKTVDGKYTSIVFHDKLNKVGLSIAGKKVAIPEPAPFHSNMYSPVPMPGSGCQAINGGSNTVVKEFEPRPPLLVVKGPGKVILHVPYTGKLLVKLKCHDSPPRLASGSDVGIRNKETKVLIKPVDARDSSGKKEVIGAWYINRSPLSYRSPRFDTLEAFLGSFDPETHGALHALVEGLSTPEKEALHGFVRGDLSLLDALHLGSLFPVVESVLGRNHEPGHPKVESIVSEVLALPGQNVMKSLAKLFTGGVDGVPVGGSMKARSLFMALLHGIVVRYLQGFGSKKNTLYRRAKRLRKSVEKQVSENGSTLLAKNRKTMSVISLLQRSMVPGDKINRLQRSSNAGKQGLAAKLEKFNGVKQAMITACHAKVARRSKNVARCTAAVSVNMSDTFGVDVDYYEDLRFTSTFAPGSGKSCRGFDHSQIIGRATELDEIRGREVTTVNASHSSKLSPSAMLDGATGRKAEKDGIPFVETGYEIPVSRSNWTGGRVFCPSPGGNVAVDVHGGATYVGNRDGGAAIVVGCRGWNKKRKSRRKNSFVYMTGEHP